MEMLRGIVCGPCQPTPSPDQGDPEAEFTIFGGDTVGSSEDRITSSLSLWLHAVMSADRGHYLLYKNHGEPFSTSCEGERVHLHWLPNFTIDQFTWDSYVPISVHSDAVVGMQREAWN